MKKDVVANVSYVCPLGLVAHVPQTYQAAHLIQKFGFGAFIWEIEIPLIVCRFVYYQRRLVLISSWASFSHNLMAKRYYDFSFELSIDGNPRPSETASPLYQRDPWPGGHQYSCVISGPRVGKYFDYLPIGYRKPVLPDEASRFFLSLGLQWTENEQVPPLFFLNSVEELDFDGACIKFAGVCSPVVRQ